MSHRADQLRNGGSTSAQGMLMVDEARAREKLWKFRLANPHYYVLQFVRAASLLGASRIEFEIDTDEMSCRFDAPLPGECLEDFWSRAYGERQDAIDQAVYQLALGLGSARALNPQTMVLETAAGDGVRLVIGEDDDDLRTPTDEEGAWTRIYVREKFRLGHLPEFFASQFGEVEEVRALRKRCEFASLHVVANGEVVSVPLFDGDEGVVRRSSESTRVAVGLTVDLPTRTCARLPDPGRFRAVVVSDSVSVGRLRGLPHGFSGVGRLESRRLRTDLSSLAVVEDEQYQRLVRRDLYGAYHDAVRRVLKRRPDYLNDAELRHLLGQVADWIFEGRSAGTPVAEETMRLFRHLCGLRIIPRADGGRSHTSVDELANVAPGETPDALPYATLAYPNIEMEAWPAVARKDLDTNVFSTLQSVGSVLQAPPENVTATLQTEKRRRQNRARWEAQEPQPFPDAPPYHEARVGELIGRVYLGGVAETTRDSLRTGTSYRIDGRTIRQTVDADTPFFVVMDGDFEPNDMYDGVVIDDRVTELAVALGDVLIDLVDGLAAEYARTDRPVPADIRTVFWWWLEHILEGDALDLFLHQLGIPRARATHAALNSGLMSPKARYGVCWTEEDTPPEMVLDQLGPIVEVELVRDVFGGRHSLEEIAERGSVTFVDSRDAVEGSAGLALAADPGHQSVLQRLADVTVRRSRSVTPLRHGPDGPTETADELVADLLTGELRGRDQDAGSEEVAGLVDDIWDERLPKEAKDEFSTRSGVRVAPSRDTVPVDPVLTAVADLLLTLRGERTDLLDDGLATSTRWSPTPTELCGVSGEELLVNPDHPLVAEIDVEDPVSVRIFASVLYSEINRHYAEISDYHDLEMQRRLLRGWHVGHTFAPDLQRKLLEELTDE